jgi:hypothetical protein
MDIEHVSRESAGTGGVVEGGDATGPGEPTIEPGADRDRRALEALEGELAVLEDELARVDADRGAPAPGEHR